MQLDNLYQEVILDHYKNPQNKKLSTNYDAQVHHVNPSCGDEIDLNITIKDGTVAAITWDGVGCSISQASVSILTDLLIGKSVSAGTTRTTIDYIEGEQRAGEVARMLSGETLTDKTLAHARELLAG